MKTSAGIIVKYKNAKFLLGHSTGNSHFDIFKGNVEDGESNLEAALRECKEESNLTFKKEDLIYLGDFKYNKKKRLVLYYINVNDVPFEKLDCISFVDDDKTKKEIDYYALFDYKTMLKHCSKSLARTLESIERTLNK